MSTVVPGRSACPGCIYKGVPPREKFPVSGVTPAVVTSIEATEVLQDSVGIGKTLVNRLLVCDGLNVRFTEMPTRRTPNSEYCGHLVERDRK